jgi:predicted DNA-binding transcriptional regulator AlpA
MSDLQTAIELFASRRIAPPPLIFIDERRRSKRSRRKPTSVAPQALPPTLAPRLICREAAAAYVAVSPTTFDKMVDDGLMPHPRRLTERRLAWDLRQLDAAVDRLPSYGVADNADDATDHSWDDIDAQAKNEPAVH